MAQALAVKSPSSLEDLATVPIDVNVDGDFNITCSQPYIHIDQNTGVILEWKLQTAPPGVIFDTPAITMFGEEPNIAFHPPTPNVRRATWFNEEKVKGRSYSYRLHFLNTQANVGFSLDPIIHNDPPSAP